MKNYLILSSCSIALSSLTHAVGFRLPNQDPDGIARGNAFVATADNPSAIYHNPAGITQLEGRQLSLGFYNISTDIDYTGAFGKAETKSNVQVVPQLHFVYSPEDSPWSYGLGVYAPYGLGIDYGDDNPFNTLAQKGSLAYVSVAPTVAYKLSDSLSIGGSVTLNYSNIDFDRALTSVTDRFSFEGNDLDAGLNFGMLWQPHVKWSFGLSYKLETQMNYDGRSRAMAEFSPDTSWLDTSASLVFPQNIDLGVSYRPNKDWNFEFNIDWTDWDAVNVTTLSGTALGDVDFPFNYESSFMYEFGVTRYLCNGYYVSAGYIYSENSAPDSTFSPLNPDANLHLFSVGVGHKTDTISWALGYHMAYNSGRDVSGNTGVSLVGQTADGNYHVLNQAINLSASYKF
ncbi:MAG: OmpP1/FadL family transporter [Akkermansiaceae bacterium]